MIAKNRWWIVLAVVFVLLPLLHAGDKHISFELMNDRIDFHLGIYTLALLYVGLAMGLNFSIGFVGMLDLGYAAFIGIGAYVFAILAIQTTWPFWSLAICSALAAAVIRAALGATCLRLRGDYLAIVTLGFGEIFVTIVKNDPGRLTGGPDGLPLSLVRSSLSAHERYWIAFALAAVIIFAVHRIKFSRFGRAFEAVREDETAAEAMGVPVFRMKLLAYTIGGLIAGGLGALVAVEGSSAHPNSFDFMESARIVAMVVVGGVGSILGATMGSLFFVIILEIFRPLAQYRVLIFGIVMVLIMIARPQGIFGCERRSVK